MQLRRIPAALGRTALLLALTLHLTACTPATPLGITTPGKAFESERTFRGVVNGFWKYDSAQNTARLRGSWGKADEIKASALASRYLVRMGIDRSYFMGRFVGLVVLPEGWIYSLAEVVDDGRTINIGDVIDTRAIVGTNLVEVVALVRKCNAPAESGENKDWSIGCKQIAAFDSFGYAGEKYYLSVF